MVASLSSLRAGLPYLPMDMTTGLILEPMYAARMMAQIPQDVEAPEDVINTALLARRERDRKIVELFGAPVYRETTILPLIGKPPLGPAFAPDGHEIVWSLWSPHRYALLDIFRRQLPGEEELRARAAFAETHHIKYAIVRPGWKLTLDHVKGWLK